MFLALSPSEDIVGIIIAITSRPTISQIIPAAINPLSFSITKELPHYYSFFIINYRAYGDLTVY